MNELNKTLAFVGVALLMTGTAVVATWPRGGTSRDFSDQGEPFFPAFKSPLEATSLEVVDYDDRTAEARAFKVMLKDGKWVIPSHHDYPADAKDRLAKTASGVMDLRKDVIVSDSPDDYERLGVIDPLDAKSASLKGRGKRVTLKNQAGETLADFIVGKEVSGRTGQRYVRVPDSNQKRTYAVNVNVELTTRFQDWIEKNLLKLDTGRVRKVIFDNHRVDPEQGTVERGEVLTIEKKDATSPWSMEGLEPGQEVNTEKTGDLTRALGDLEIIGVRTKPEGLTQALKAAEGKGIALTREALLSLQRRGFYMTREGSLLSNYGDVIVATDEGVVYTLRFGEVTFASGEALSAGLEDSAGAEEAAKGQAKESEKGEDKEKDKDKKAESVEGRYLFVTAGFDPTLIPEPKAAEPEQSDELPADAFAKSGEERAKKVKEDKEKADRERADYDKKVEDGKKKAQELTDRFAAWYYVVPGSAFRNVVLDRPALVRKKSDKPTPPGGGDFSFPGAGGLPGGAGAGAFPGGGAVPHP